MNNHIINNHTYKFTSFFPIMNMIYNIHYLNMFAITTHIIDIKVQ